MDPAMVKQMLEEQRANFQDELSLGEFSMDCGFCEPSGLHVNLCLEPVARLNTPPKRVARCGKWSRMRTPRSTGHLL